MRRVCRRARRKWRESDLKISCCLRKRSKIIMRILLTPSMALALLASSSFPSQSSAFAPRASSSSLVGFKNRVRISSTHCTSTCFKTSKKDDSSLAPHLSMKMSSQALQDSKNESSHAQIDDEIIALNQRLLNAIVRGDYDTYSLLCSDDMTCFEPEANECLVKGKEFHKFYFNLPNNTNSKVETNVTMCDVHVRRIGTNVCIVSYVRLNQMYVEGKAITTKTCETRVWEHKNNEWKNVHLHRS